MNEKYLHDLIDEALQIQHRGGDLEAFYQLHEEYRSEITSLIVMGKPLRSLAHTEAPRTLRDQASRITAHDQERVTTWQMFLAPQILFRATAFAVFVILLGGGFAYQQNTTRKETLAAFDAVAIDHQNFLNTVGEPPVVAALSQMTTSDIPLSPAPTLMAPKAGIAPTNETPPSLGAEVLVAPATGLGALYDAQEALDALQNDINVLP